MRYNENVNEIDSNDPADFEKAMMETPLQSPLEYDPPWLMTAKACVGLKVGKPEKFVNDCLIAARVESIKPCDHISFNNYGIRCKPVVGAIYVVEDYVGIITKVEDGVAKEIILCHSKVKIVEAKSYGSHVRICRPKDFAL